MLGACVIVFREVLEAGLIVGIVLAATRSLRGRAPWVILGLLAGVAGSGLVAMLTSQIASLFAGSGQELFNAAILLVAVGLLGWHTIWMTVHGRQMAQDAKTWSDEIATGGRGLAAISTVIALTVLREGSEAVVFLYGMSVSEPLSSVLAGGLLGVLLGALTSVLVYFGLLTIPLRYFFSVTGWLVTFLAAGLSAQAVGFLQQAGWIERWSVPLWNTSAFLSEGSWPGRILHALIGYTDQPTGAQILAYVATIVLLTGFAKVVHCRNVSVSANKSAALAS